MINPPKHKAKGVVALPVVMGITFAILLIGLSASYVGFNALISSSESRESVTAFNFADAGVTDALRKISIDKNCATTTPPPAGSWQCAGLGDDYQIELASPSGCSAPWDGCATVTIDSSTTASSIVKTITSEGRYKNSIRSVTMIVQMGLDGNITETIYREIERPASVLYWVGGSGNWSDANKWSLTSSGAGGAGVPSSGTDARFTCSSFTANNQKVTINSSSSVRNLDMTAITTACSPLYTGIGLTFSSFVTLNVYGSLKFSPDGTDIMAQKITGNGYLHFRSTSPGNEIDLGGSKPVSLTQGITFDGLGGDWKLMSNLTAEGGTNITYEYFTINRGTLDTNGKNLSTKTFRVMQTGAKGLHLKGSTVFSIARGSTDAWNMAGSDFTLTVDSTSTIKFTGSGVVFNGEFTGSPTSYGTVRFEGGGNAQIKGNNSFAALEVHAPNSWRDHQLVLYGDQTVSAGFVAVGGGPEGYKRIFINSSERGVERKIVAPSMSLTNTDFMDIAACATAGCTAAPTFSLASSVGNALGNRNLDSAFTSPKTVFWVGNSGNWSNSSKWASSSNGAGGAGYPLPQDTVYFDANSFTQTGRRATADMLLLGRNISFMGESDVSPVANSPEFYMGWGGSFEGVKFIGDLKMAGTCDLPAMTWGGVYTTAEFSPRGEASWRTGCVTSPRAIRVDAPGGELTLLDELRMNISSSTFGKLTLTKGTFDANGNDVRMHTFESSGTGTRTIKMGGLLTSGFWNIEAWNTADTTNLSLDAGESTIRLGFNATSSSFTTGELAQNFYNLRIGGPSTNVSVTSTINAPVTFNDITIDAPNANLISKTVNFKDGVTVGTGSLNASGIGVNARLLLRSTATGEQWRVNVTKISSLNGSRTFLDVRDSDASGSTSTLSCSNCINSGNNAGWAF